MTPVKVKSAWCSSEGLVVLGQGREKRVRRRLGGCGDSPGAHTSHLCALTALMTGARGQVALHFRGRFQLDLLLWGSSPLSPLELHPELRRILASVSLQQCTHSTGLGL